MCGGEHAPRYAYATLLATADYLPGALALSRSLRACGSSLPLVVLIEEAVADSRTVAAIEAEGALPHVIAPMPFSDAFCSRHSGARIHARDPFQNGDKPRFHSPLRNFSKLRIWELEQYERVAFLDADAVALRNPDGLFGYEPFAAGPNLYLRDDPHRRLNSGVFVAAPDRPLFEQMLVRLQAGHAYWRRTDQTFLESVFPSWDRLPPKFNTLQYRWLNMPECWDWDDVVVLHFQYEKPWDPGAGQSHRLEPMRAVWTHIFDHGRAPASLPPSPRC